MTEREKMLSGRLYDPSDPALTRQRRQARRLANAFNRTDEDDTAERRRILHALFGHVGEGTELNPEIRADYGMNTYIGDLCYFNFNTTFLDCAEIRFGTQVMVGPNVSFLTPLHPLVAEERAYRCREDGSLYALEYCRPIYVGSHVWIGGNVTVNGGVSIGGGAVIGSGSVVTRDIPPGVVAAGIPCRVLRPITGADRMEQDHRPNQGGPL